MKKQFLHFCISNKLQQNAAQFKTLELLYNFNKTTSFQNLLSKLFKKAEHKLGFYLYGDVGVGKTMLLNFFFNNLKISKQRMHFNEFMINFHNFRHSNKLKEKDNSIETFVRSLKKKK